MPHTPYIGVTLVTDSMVNEEARVQVLEMQKVEHSAFYGYGKAYKADLKDKIRDVYRRNSLAPNATPALLFEKMCDNKAYQAAFAQQAAPEIFPWQKPYAYVPGQDLAPQIRQECPTKVFIAKIPDAYRGEGVYCLNRETMDIYDNASSMHHMIAEWNDQSMRFGGFLSPRILKLAPELERENDILDRGILRLPGAYTPRQNFIAAQSCVTPRAINVKNKIFRPTIRTAMVIGWNPLQPETTMVEIVGSYYKLPAEPDKGRQDFFKHFNPARLISHISSGIGAWRIEPADERAIAEQMPAAIKSIFNFAQTHDPEQLILNCLKSGNPGHVVAGIDYMRAMDGKDYPFSDDFVHNIAKPWADAARAMPSTLPVCFSPWVSNGLHDKFQKITHELSIEADVLFDFRQENLQGTIKDTLYVSTGDRRREIPPYMMQKADFGMQR